jgi:hypothetical protein
MDMVVDDQRQTALEQEMGMELSLTFRNSSSTGHDELPLAQQQELEEEQDRSPLLGPAPQPSSQPPPDPYPPSIPPACPPSSPACCSSSGDAAPSSRQYHKKVDYQIQEWTPKLDKERNLWKLACKIRVWEMSVFFQLFFS